MVFFGSSFKTRWPKWVHHGPSWTLGNAVGSLIPLSQRWCLAGVKHRIWRKLLKLQEMERISLEVPTYLEKKPFFLEWWIYTRENENAIWHFYKYIPGMRNHHFFCKFLLLNRTSPRPMLWTWTWILCMLLNPHPFTETSQRRHVGTSSAGRRLSKDEASCDLPVDLNFLRRLLWIEIEGFNKNGRRYPSGG